MAFIARQLVSKLYRFSSCNTQCISSKILPAVAVPITSSKSYSNVPTPYELVDSKQENKSRDDIIKAVKNLLVDNKQGRAFAVVHIAGKQFKITTGDVVVIEGYWPPQVGDKISLDKVLLAGTVDFTLIGRPIVQRGLVQVQATVIEKGLSHTKTHFRKKRRKQYMRINFYRIPQTYLRINDIKIGTEIDNPPEVRGLESVVF